MPSNLTGFIDHMHTMAESPVRNYAIAGLKSELLTNGTVRLFTQETIQLSMITPHSHRYNLGCLVLKGEVKNTEWHNAEEDYAGPKHLMQVSVQKYESMGKYEITEQRIEHFRIVNVWYKTNDFYFINATEIHSIQFSPGAEVLVFQGPQRFDKSVILEPVGDDGVIPIFETLPWMFK